MNFPMAISKMCIEIRNIYKFKLIIVNPRERHLVRVFSSMNLLFVCHVSKVYRLVNDVDHLQQVAINTEQIMIITTRARAFFIHNSVFTDHICVVCIVLSVRWNNYFRQTADCKL